MIKKTTKAEKKFIYTGLDELTRDFSDGGLEELKEKINEIIRFINK